MENAIKHKNNPNNFCYICGEIAFKNQQKFLNDKIRLMYNQYFGLEINAGENIKYAPNICCLTCCRRLYSWFRGQCDSMPFGTPMLWAPLIEHTEESCYFCVVDIIGYTKKTKSLINYPNFDTAIRPTPHSETTPVPTSDTNDMKVLLIIPESLEAQSTFDELNNVPSKFDEHQKMLVENWNHLRWICYYCHYSSNEYLSLKSHHQLVHNITNAEEIYFLCSHCKEAVLGYALFLSHLRSVHHATLKLCCDVCNECFLDYEALSVHRDEHIEIFNTFPAVYHCTLCENVQATEKELKNHIQHSHSLISESTESSRHILPIVKEEDTEISVPSTPLETPKFFQNNIHCKEEYHDTEQTFQCGKCVQSFRKEIELTIHLRMHISQPFKCETCSKRFYRKSNWTVHKRIHIKERPFKCKFCEKRFKREGDCKIHSVTHNVKRPYKCDCCEKRFKKESDCKFHMRIHTGNRPNECTICSKSFHSASTLKTHMHTHTNERAYECKLCSEAFLNEGLLRHTCKFTPMKLH